MTVERKVGEYRREGQTIRVVDLPGIYSLSAMSIDEQVAREYILSGEADVIVNIVDASNLERNLYLTVQLLEMRVPVIVALNMMDVVSDRKTAINVSALSQRLGCPVIPMVASREQGVDELRNAIEKAAQQPPISPIQIAYPTEIARAIDDLAAAIQPEANGRFHAAWAATKLLEGDQALTRQLGASAHAAADR